MNFRPLTAAMKRPLLTCEGWRTGFGQFGQNFSSSHPTGFFKERVWWGGLRCVEASGSRPPLHILRASRAAKRKEQGAHCELNAQRGLWLRFPIPPLAELQQRTRLQTGDEWKIWPCKQEHQAVIRWSLKQTVSQHVTGSHMKTHVTLL